MLLAGPDPHWRINHVEWFRALSKAQNAPFFQGPLFQKWLVAGSRGGFSDLDTTSLQRSKTATAATVAVAADLMFKRSDFGSGRLLATKDLGGTTDDHRPLACRR
ncbi:unnamed protein product [Cuscuta campestris]|uniref:Uncharacterized protein n=1 Tax=Cuscuta campestris TaxID=132261 RepID=A0A484N5M1_9ASTE|nr:unnamed protein product [Cuscuta campestris]